ncbi:MAG: DUF1553 domain-containing protein [Verrucomicrobia bacterium]|nr:DUF1553 domain-containing protein [Verrucomicrobiota bacterium]
MNPNVPPVKPSLLLSLILAGTFYPPTGATPAGHGFDSARQHWAFRQLQLPSLPPVKNLAWPRNGIDYFVLSRLEKEGRQPTREADPATLIRRVALDLTGLPPTPEEVDDFLADISPNAYEKVVERLLASPRYGERMAIVWLEAARYADTNGYQSDGERFMWRWRDWVIDAFNKNMPFDRFTIEQIAGDLLPAATLDQRIATGFNRNHRGNGEGGIIPEEYAVEYVVDRVDTTCTVWLGLTMGCARCHDHKYDPFTQKEFYQLFAFFNNLPEKGRANKFGNSPPLIKAPTAAQAKRLEDLDAKLAAAEMEFRVLEPEIASAQEAWEQSLSKAASRVGIANLKTEAGPEEGHGNREEAGSVKSDPEPRTVIDLASVSDGLRAHFPLDRDTLCAPGTTNSVQIQDGDAAFAAGRIGLAAEFDGQRFLAAGDAGNFGFLDKFSFAAWIFPKDGNAGAVLSRMAETPEAEGYSFCMSNGRVQLNLVKRWLDDALRVETNADLEPNRWHHIVATYDGSRVAEGIRIYIDGSALLIKVNLDELNQSFKTSEPFRIGSGGGPETRFHGLVDDVRIYHRALDPDEARILSTSETIAEILSRPRDQRSSAQTLKLRTFFLDNRAPDHLRRLRADLKAIRGAREEFYDGLPTTMVMEEMARPRETRILFRGQYDKPGDRVNANVPAVLPPMAQIAERNRLGLAKWLVDPANPLTARVAVNQYWQLLFGTGLVKTAEDFGTRGELSSHPELLDWMASELIRSGWNVKALQRLIVLSATYRQSSRVSSELVRRDPENRWLARGSRIRLPAEIVRDQALAIGGLLVEHLRGPSVKPYQPAGLWNELSGTDYTPDKGEKLYRRSLYTFWKRTSPPPMMSVFDAAGREACSVRQSRTSTPIQALDMMNDVTFVEAARALAERVMKEAGVSAEARISRAFRRATARQPGPKELRILLDNLNDHLAYYRAHPEAAAELCRVGELPTQPETDPVELAAYTGVASLILNLDETLTKQ